MKNPLPYSGDLVEHLRAFVAFSDQLQEDKRAAFEETANSLSIDASVLRRRLQSLANYYEAPLLEGRGGGLRLTTAGAAVAAGAVRILQALERLRDDVGASPTHLTFACTGTVTTELLPEVIASVGQTYPKLTIRVLRAGAASSRELLQSGVADLAVVRAEAPPLNLQAEELCRDRLWLAVASAHPLARTRRLTAAKMAELPLVGYRARSSTRRRVMSVLGPLGAEIRYEVDGRAAALKFVELGLGAAFLSLLPGHRIDHPGVAVRDVSNLFPETRFWLCQPERATTNEVIHTAISAMHRFAKKSRR